MNYLLDNDDIFKNSSIWNEGTLIWRDKFTEVYFESTGQYFWNDFVYDIIKTYGSKGLDIVKVTHFVNAGNEGFVKDMIRKKNPILLELNCN